MSKAFAQLSMLTGISEDDIKGLIESHSQKAGEH
jgi:hypothetical protein